MANNTKEVVDFHVHSLGSNDAAFSIDKIITIAKNSNVKRLAITDHNTYSEVVKFWKGRETDLSTPVINVDGVEVIAGTEVTCRVSQITNLRGNSSKIHVLVYGADMSPNSPLAQLLAIKRKNDLDCDIGLLRDVLQYNGYYNINEDDIRAFIRQRRQDVPGFSDLGKKDVWDFLQTHNITIATSYKELCDIMSHLPRYERLNIEFDDLVKVAKASGGELVVAHLGVNLERLSNVNRRALVEYLSTQVDGFERYYQMPGTETWRLITNALNGNGRDREVYATGGSDFHDASHGLNLGKAQKKAITSDMTSDFIDNIDSLCRAREEGKLSHRDNINIPVEETNRIINSYKQKYNEIITNSAPEVSLQDWQRNNRNKSAKKGKKNLTAKDRAKLRQDKWIKSGKMPVDFYIEEAKKKEKENEMEM